MSSKLPMILRSNMNRKYIGNLERSFARVNQMNSIGDGKYWSKRPSWKQPKYDHNIKSHEALQKLKHTLHAASCDKWQSCHEIPCKLLQYYSTKGSCIEESTPIH